MSERHGLSASSGVTAELGALLQRGRGLFLFFLNFVWLVILSRYFILGSKFDLFGFGSKPLRFPKA